MEYELVFNLIFLNYKINYDDITLFVNKTLLSYNEFLLHMLFNFVEFFYSLKISIVLCCFLFISATICFVLFFSLPSDSQPESEASKEPNSESDSQPESEASKEPNSKSDSQPESKTDTKDNKSWIDKLFNFVEKIIEIVVYVNPVKISINPVSCMIGLVILIIIIHIASENPDANLPSQ